MIMRLASSLSEIKPSYDVVVVGSGYGGGVTAARLARAITVASGLGTTSAHTWLKMPSCESPEQVFAATTLPCVVLGGGTVGLCTVPSLQAVGVDRVDLIARHPHQIEAARRLGVKPATLYAYVSRGVLTSRRGSDGRTSVFDAADIEELARRGRPRRSSRNASLDIDIETSLTTIEHEVLRFRGHDATRLARRHTFEEVATLLWTGELLASGETWPVAPVDVPDRGGFLDRLTWAAQAAAVDDPDRRSHDVAAVGHLQRLGYPPLPEGLDAWAGVENFENRLHDGVIEPVLLDQLRGAAADAPG